MHLGSVQFCPLGKGFPQDLQEYIISPCGDRGFPEVFLLGLAKLAPWWREIFFIKSLTEISCFPNRKMSDGEMNAWDTLVSLLLPSFCSQVPFLLRQSVSSSFPSSMYISSAWRRLTVVLAKTMSHSGDLPIVNFCSPILGNHFFHRRRIKCGRVISETKCRTY